MSETDAFFALIDSLKSTVSKPSAPESCAKINLGEKTKTLGHASALARSDARNIYTTRADARDQEFFLPEHAGIATALETFGATVLATPKETAGKILENLGVRFVYVVDSAGLESALNCLLQSTSCLGLDIETCGRPEFAGDKRAGLEPRKSLIRLIQIYDGAR